MFTVRLNNYFRVFLIFNEEDGKSRGLEKEEKEGTKKQSAKENPSIFFHTSKKNNTIKLT